MQNAIQESIQKKRNMPDSVIIICLTIIGSMSFFTFCDYIFNDPLRLRLTQAIIASLVLVVTPLYAIYLGFIKKSVFKGLFYTTIALTLSGLFFYYSYIGMKVSVPESYYKQLNTILEDKRLPSSIRLFLHIAAQDGRISYQEWVNFSMKYETYSNEQGLGCLNRSIRTAGSVDIRTVN